MSARDEIALLLQRLRTLESCPCNARNRSVIEIGCQAIRERLSMVSRLQGLSRVRVI